MRLIIIGSLNGQIGAASQVAISRGAKVAHAEDIEAALHALRSGQGADMVMCDVKLDIRRLRPSDVISIALSPEEEEAVERAMSR